MTNNRGNISSSNSNIPSTKDMKDGIHKTNDSKHMEYVDPNTITNINKMTKKYEMYIKNVYGTLEGFEDAIKKATETAIKSQENEEKIKTKFNKELNALAETFGESSKEFKTHLNIAKKEMKLAKNESKETLLNIKKDFIKQSFKNESKQNEIKFMSNKFSKGNNLASTSNEYYNQLEKLKSDALDVYGEGFENNKEYKKALMNLNDKYAKDMKDAWKEDFKENHKVLGGIASGIKDTFERNKESLQGLLGPLNLFIAPLKDFFGGFGAIFKFVGGGVKKLFGKFTKKNPTASDVLKSGAFGVGALYIGSKLEQMFGETKGEGGGLSSLKDKFLEPLEGMKEIFGKNSNFMKNARLISGMGGGLMVVADFISEFQKTGDWRGALSKGITGSSKLENAIKGAFLGFSIAGPVGLLVGALGGVALNYFSPQVEKFIRMMTGDVSAKKKQLLENIEKDVKKGKRTQQELDIYTKLAQSGMDDADFASLGKDLLESEKHNRVDWIRQYAKGNLSSLNDDEFNFMGNLFMTKGYELTQSLGTEKFKALLEVLNDVRDDSELKSIMLNEKSLSGFIAKTLNGDIDSTTKEILKNALTVLDPKNKIKVDSIDDAIIRTDGSIIKTNPKDTLVALKDIPLSMEQVRSNTTKNLNSSLNGLGSDKTLEKKLTTIIDVLSKILAKDVQVNLPPQTRGDLDMIMSGGMI